jgi:hypothetical protein
MNPYNNYNMGMNNFYPNQFSTLTQPQMSTQNLIRVNGIDGAPVQGATAIVTATAIGDVVTLPISALVRLNCDCDTANLTIVIGGQVVTAQNLALVVEKE